MYKHYRLPLLFSLSLFGLLLTVPNIAFSKSTSALSIIEKANKINSGEDGTATVAFKTEHGNSSAVDRMEMTRVWKKYHKNGIHSKMLFFSTYPPSSVGVATMVVAYNFEQHKQPETWVYIPVLRKVKKLPPLTDKNQNRGEDDPYFASSLLKNRELVPRNPTLDHHKALRIEKLNGVAHYVIESIPKAREGEKYSKMIRWISKDHYLLSKEVFYVKGVKTLVKKIQWKKINGAWAWTKVTGKHINNTKTTVTLSNIKINVGLKDKIFNKRTLKRGWK